jgi:hypothetical protein
VWQRTRRCAMAALADPGVHGALSRSDASNFEPHSWAARTGTPFTSQVNASTGQAAGAGDSNAPAITAAAPELPPNCDEAPAQLL